MTRAAGTRPPALAVAGWKSSGKTTLVERLVAELTRRGRRIATVKHAHHGFDIDREGTDSARHRAAGAVEVAIVSSRRWALVHELSAGEPEPPLEAILARLAPCDLVVVEGYKRSALPKIEVRRTAGRQGAPLAPDDPLVIAIAADHTVDSGALPFFDLDDVAGLATFIETRLGLAPGPAGRP